MPLEDLWTALGTVIAPPACAVCRAPLRPPRVTGWRGLLCSSCSSGVAAPAACDDARVTSTTALFRYRAEGRSLLRRLKYDARDDLGVPLGEGLAARFAQDQPARAADPGLIVVPVPLHRWRRWRRGFNQAERIAAGVARALGRPLDLSLVRRRRTPPLYGVPRGARPAVVADAFGVRDPARVRGRPIALVDDIRTTGATLAASAAALRAAGATRVHALVAAT